MTTTPAIWAEEKGTAYIFAGAPNLIKYVKGRNEFQTVPSNLPPVRYATQAVWNGRYGYIVGFEGGSGGLDSGIIIQFDPEDEVFYPIPLEGHFDWTLYNWQFAAVVYVEKLNRIYMFGGYRPDVYNDGIYYIELDPIDP